MLKHALFIALIASPVGSALANDRLERIESISEQMTALMFDAMLGEFSAQGVDISTLEDAVPDTAWDATMREAGQCVVDRFTETVGVEKLDAMLDTLEARLPAIEQGGMAAIEDMQSLLPDGMSEADANAINDQCGMTDLMQQKLMSPEFMSAVMALMSDS